MIIDNGIDVYSIGADGEKIYSSTSKFSIDGEDVCKFDVDKGILEISIREEDVPVLIKLVGGLPAKKIIIPSPEGNLRFHDVKEIKSLPKKDGSFFLRIVDKEKEADEAYKSLDVYSGNKTNCNNCKREFKAGEVISVDQKNRTFCYSDSEGGCVPAFTFKTGEMIISVPKRYGESTLPTSERTPNYPNSPIRNNVGRLSRLMRYLKALLSL